MSHRFIYEFHFPDQEVRKFKVITGQPESRKSAQKDEPTPWTLLNFNQCKNCPFSKDDRECCPVALDIEEIAASFCNILSYEKAEVRVITEQREYRKVCDVQTGLKSLLGLIMGSSECPILSHLEPMAHYHLPFSSIEETIFRVTGSYMLKQYYISLEGHTPDLELIGLQELYENLQIVNIDFMRRIQEASRSDANMNALNILFALSSVVSMTLVEKLQELRPLFFRSLGNNEMKPHRNPEPDVDNAKTS